MHISSEGAEGGSFFPAPATTYLVLFLCFCAILSEGYDVGVMGAVVPALMVDVNWHLSPVQIGAMGSAALFGTLFGSWFISVLSDLMGRKFLLISCVALFSLSMLAAAVAPTPVVFSVARFIGGLGLGGVISVASALTVEYSPTHRKNLNFALMYSGYSLGALLSALAGMAFLPGAGWRFVVGVGAAPLLGLPLLMRLLPESLEFLVAKGRLDDARKLARRLGVVGEIPAASGTSAVKASVREVFVEVFSTRNRAATLTLWLAQLAVVMVIYGLGTWLPQIMRKVGYDLGSSLSFLAVFMLSSAIGGIAIGRIADRCGARLTLVSCYVIGALSIAALALKGSLTVNYILVACAGFGSIGVAMVQLGYIANYYAAHARASATGWAVGVGRLGAMAGPLIGGVLVAQHLDVAWNFYVFAAAALVAALAIFFTPPPLPRLPLPRERENDDSVCLASGSASQSR
jgi:AAHS family benzoate transporter-like MFS transporter